MEKTLEKAIALMAEGKEEGFNAVYSETYNHVYFRAKNIMKTEEDAQDLVQIVFIEAYKCINTLESSEALYKWLDGITYRQGMKIFRKQRDVLLTEEAEGLFETLENNDISTMPELTADQKMTSEIIQGIIEELPELQKTAVVMYYYDGLKVEQIADMMECSTGTIKSRLNYARKYIKDRVEEKEKKEGYRLHVFALPVLWYGIKMLADKTTLTVQAAQKIYDGACVKVGLKATAITITAAGNTAAGGGVASSVAGGAAKSAGIASKFAQLSTTMKVLVIAGAVALGGGGTAAVIHAVSNQNEEPVMEETIENAFEEAEETLEEMTEIEPEEESVPVLLTEENQNQLATFAAAMFVYTGENSEVVFPTTPDDCLTFIYNYINMVTYSWGELTEASSPTDLPYDWYSGNLTKEEIAEFCKSGFGVEIPADYSYRVGDDEWGIKVEDGKLVSTYDMRTQQVIGDSIEIVSQNEEEIILTGTCSSYDPDPRNFNFTMKGIPSGNQNVFGGITVTEITVEEDVPETLAEIDLSEFICLHCDTSIEEWATEDYGTKFTHTDAPLYIRSTPIGFEGYWTIEGQEIYFAGDYGKVLYVSDIAGNPLDLRIGFWDMSYPEGSFSDVFIFINLPKDDELVHYAFQDYPNYAYTR